MTDQDQDQEFEFHVPFVPNREPAAPAGDPGELPTREDLTPRQPPPGLSRRDRKDWAEMEGRRIADLQATVPSLRKAGLPVGPPRKLGRAGKREWKDAHRENMAARRKDERRRSGNERALGALLVAVVLVGGYFVARAFIGGDDPAPVAAQPSVTAPVAPTTVDPTTGGVTTTADAVAVSRDVTAAEAAALAWFTVTCPLREDQWAPARPLMTEDAWDQVNRTPPVVQATWSCAALDVEQSRYQFEPGIVSLRFEAHRTITTGTTPEVTEKVQFTRNLIQQDGAWLIDVVQAD